MKNIFKGICIFLICFLLCTGCYFILGSIGRKEEARILSSYTDSYSEKEKESSSDQEAEEIVLSESQTEINRLSVDFQALRKTNPDIYAWLDITGSEISYPVLQHSSDDSYYLSHNWEGESSSTGAVFSEKTYTSTDFSDPVTILYGHRLRKGGIFSKLEELYSDRESFDAHSLITVYLPDRQINYRVVASLPFDNRHIMYYFDFENTDQAEAFFKEAFATKNTQANYVSDFTYDPDTRYLILSTCLWADKNQRYLVIAQETVGGEIQ